MRPGCDRPAVSRLSYDTITCQVWLDPVPERPGRAQEICELHTSRLTVPRGWVLCDRRGDAPALFVPPAVPEPPAPVAPDVAAAEQPRTNGTTRNGEVARSPRRRVRTAPEPALFESPVEADDSGPERERTPRRNGSAPAAPRVAATVPVSVEPVELVEAVVTEEVSASAAVEEPEATEATAPPEVAEATEPSSAPAQTEPEQVEERDDLPTSPLLARAFRATGPQRSVLTQTLLNDAD